MAIDRPTQDIIWAIRHPELINDDISPQQEICLRALYGLPLSRGRIKTRVFKNERFHWVQEGAGQWFRRATGRAEYKPREYHEAGFYLGARSGKDDKLASNIAIYEACFRPHKLSRGERALIPVIAKDRKQAAIAYNFICGKLTASPALKELVGNLRADEIELTNNVTIAVWTCSFRTLRGSAIPCAILDELAVWFDEETRANPATEVIRSVRRGMGMFPDHKLIKISSPYAKTGPVWDDCTHRDELKDVLVVNAPTWEMNPAFTDEALLGEFRRDPAFFWREFGAKFVDAVSPLVDPEKVDAAIAKGQVEREPEVQRFHYHAVIDAAFRRDDFTFSMGHRGPNGAVVDFVRVWEGSRKSPVQMKDAMSEITATARRYGVAMVVGDQFCSEPIRQALAEQGMGFSEYIFTANSKQQVFGTLRTLLMSGGLELPDHPLTVEQIKSLEVTAGPGGTLRVQGQQGRKDDCATVAALVAHLAMETGGGAEAWTEAFRTMSEGSTPEAGRTMCVDCGRTIPFNEEYAGVGPNMGQCRNCMKAGAPTYKAVLPQESSPRPLGSAV